MDKHGWTYKKLGEVCEVINGFAFKSDKYVDEGIRVMRITNVQKGTIVDNDPKYYPNKEALNISQYLLNENDLLMSLTGNVGRVGLLQKELLPAALNQRVACLRIKSHNILLKYLFHLLDSDFFEKDCIFNASGIAQKNMSTEWLKKYPIPIPPLAEQERIVAELDLLSSIIEKKKAQLQEYDKLAQSIFYDMFGDPITNDKGWDVKKLRDIGKIITGNTPSTRDDRNYDSDDVCFFKPSDIVKDGISHLGESEFHVSTFAYNNARKLPKGSVLVTCIGIVGKVGILEIDAMCNQQINAIIPNEDVDSVFVAYSVLSERKIIESIAHAPVVPIINKGEFSQLCVPLPPLNLQQEFAEKIEAIEKQKALVQASIVETETLFNSRMDYYFG